jgi:hypothetical protein
MDRLLYELEFEKVVAEVARLQTRNEFLRIRLQVCKLFCTFPQQVNMS